MELSLPPGPSAFLEIRQIENQGCDSAPTTSQPASVLSPKNREMKTHKAEGERQAGSWWRGVLVRCWDQEERAWLFHVSWDHHPLN